MQENLDKGWKCYDAIMENYEPVRGDVLQAAEAAGMAPGQQLKLELGLEEMLVNVISYAYEEVGKVWVRAAAEGELFWLELADHGKPFNPLAKDMRHDESLPLEEREPGGFGIFLVKESFRSVEYRYEMFEGAMANHLVMALPVK